MRRLTVLYDPACAVCIRCRDWMRAQPAFVELELLACSSADAQKRYGVLPWRGQELVAISDEEHVWKGSDAFLMCLWALKDWREWSYRLASPQLAPLAERFFHALSTRRQHIATLLGWQVCEDGSCTAPVAHPYRGVVHPPR